MASEKLSPELTKSRMKAAQEIDFEVDGVCGEHVFKTIDAHCRAIGAPHPFIFFPLLTVIASCMGVKAIFTVNEEWHEPSILWTVVAARKGEKKTPACQRLLKPMAKLETDLRNEDDDNDKAPSPDRQPQLLVDYFSFEELHSLMSRSGCQILAIYDEVMTLYQQLDLYKPSGSKIDKTTLLSLFNGSSWNRNFKNNTTGKMENTAFNYSGFIQPKFLIDMLQRDDQAGFYDRIMVVCPPEISVPFQDLQVPMPADIVQFYAVFKAIRDLHQAGDIIRYTFDEEAKKTFAQYHDDLQDQKSSTDDENKRGHIVKGITHLVRLAGILHVMEQAFNAIAGNLPLTRDSWNTIISTTSLDRAFSIVSYCLNQKWALMPPSFSIDDPQRFLQTNANKIGKFLTCNKLPIPTSFAVQNHLVPPMPHPITGVIPKQPNVQTTLAFMNKLKDMGFGDVEQQSSQNKRQCNVFRKRKYNELNETCQNDLKKLKINTELYDQVFTNAPNPNMAASTSQQPSQPNASPSRSQ